MLREETPDVPRDHVAILFECEVARIEQVKLECFQVALVRMRTVCGEDTLGIRRRLSRVD